MDVVVVGSWFFVGSRAMRLGLGYGHGGLLHGREHDDGQIDLAALNGVSAARRIESEQKCVS